VQLRLGIGAGASVRRHLADETLDAVARLASRRRVLVAVESQPAWSSTEASFVGWACSAAEMAGASIT